MGRGASPSLVAKLKAGMANVAAGEGVFKEMDALYPKLRMTHYEHHIIFCLSRENTPRLGDCPLS